MIPAALPPGVASVLQVTAVDWAQTPEPSPDPTWALHLIDANVALGNLVAILGREAAAFAATPHR